MHTPFELPLLSAISSTADAVSADLIVTLYAGEPPEPFAAGLPASARPEFLSAIARGEPVSELGRVLVASAGLAAAGRAIVVGAGTGPLTAERARRAAGAAAAWARERRCVRLAVDLTRVSADVDTVTAAVAEAVVTANFNNGYLKAAAPLPPVVEASLILAAGQQPQLERGLVVGEAINAARHLANEPGNVLTPRELVDRAAALTAEPGVQAEILGPDRIEALGMGLILGVARGSNEAPALLCLTYTPPGGATGPVLGLVGKGVTFDTGGISIKPADGMDRMKDDMAGAAAVVCALRAIARLGIARKVVAVVPAVENMPGSRALKPGDVIHGAAGISVEVNNTDAEGRLILGDGLWYAKQRGATHLVDVATLTGACVVALGKTTSGLFGTPQPFVDSVSRAAGRAGESVWQLPLGQDYRDQMKSDIADIINSGGRAGGAITAAMFLKEFVGQTPWAHLDIAGTAWNDDAKPWAPKGASGVMVRTLVELAASDLPG